MAVQHAAAVITGAALVFIDPTKTLEVKFFKATPIPAAYKQSAKSPVAQVPGNASHSVGISLPNKSPKTQKGGVPNEG